MREDFDISCPKCGTTIHLDETLAGPVVSRIRAEAEETMTKTREEADARVLAAEFRETDLIKKELELADREASVQTQVNQAIASERKIIAAKERENVLKEISLEMESERARAKELEEKLAEAQEAELRLRQEKASVDERSKTIDLEVARKVDEERKTIENKTRKEIEEAANSRIAEIETALSALQNEARTNAERAVTLAETLATKERELSEKEASILVQINQAIAAERTKIAAIERQNILEELSPEIEAERKKTRDLQEKLTTAQNAELQLRNEKNAIDERANTLDLEVARKVDDQRKAIQEKTRKDADEESRLKIAEKEKTISDMQLKLEEAQRKATQGSQQLQGDVLESDLESILRRTFPQDSIEPVKAGVRGADILQRVSGHMGLPVATILWEAKRAQDWGGNWIAKAKQDAAEAKAEVSLIVSRVLPTKGVEDFEFKDGVWCVAPPYAMMLGFAIRDGVISTADARQGAIGRQTKKERLYDYMIGPEFRATLNGIGGPFKKLQDELLAEKRSTQARWKRQEKWLEQILTNVAGLQGDLRGIAGSEMPQLPGFELEAGESDLLELE